MLGDYGELIKPTESIIGVTVSNSEQKRYNGIVLEHILRNACVVRWTVLNNKKSITIEFIKDLNIK